ncbi:hypothetical protein BpHYR1_014173 [Brachionus plicatilis]|uniref:Uncharacterized protein n=1 Tax=Brachionus plicatilis TaxID=10195 RepID=A0A3M7SG87_BRAPC|nr:hypothetical protein BpHYR1_014173 [Brachionus plicatilis]
MNVLKAMKCSDLLKCCIWGLERLDIISIGFWSEKSDNHKKETRHNGAYLHIDKSLEYLSIVYFQMLAYVSDVFVNVFVNEKHLHCIQVKSRRRSGFVTRFARASSASIKNN